MLRRGFFPFAPSLFLFAILLSIGCQGWNPLAPQAAPSVAAQSGAIDLTVYNQNVALVKDKRTLALILMMPLIQLFLLGYAATNDVRNVPLAVYDQSNSPEARALLDAYRAADYFRVAFSVGSEAEIQALCDRIKVPNEERELALLACRCQRMLDAAAPAQLLALFKRADALRRPERFRLFLRAAALARPGFDGVEPGTGSPRIAPRASATKARSPGGRYGC